MKRLQERHLNVTFVSGSEIRGRFGWPCFHCGKPQSKCKPGKRCCAKCKGKRSH